MSRIAFYSVHIKICIFTNNIRDKKVIVAVTDVCNTWSRTSQKNVKPCPTRCQTRCFVENWLIFLIDMFLCGTLITKMYLSVIYMHIVVLHYMSITQVTCIRACISFKHGFKRKQKNKTAFSTLFSWMWVSGELISAPRRSIFVRLGFFSSWYQPLLTEPKYVSVAKLWWSLLFGKQMCHFQCHPPWIYDESSFRDL